MKSWLSSALSTVVCIQQIVTGIATSSQTTINNLGLVKTCGKMFTVKFTVDGRTYCVFDQGTNRKSVGEQACSQLNSKLPVPKNHEEIDQFIQITDKDFWLDISDPERTKNRANWKDSSGKTPPFVKQGYPKFQINFYHKTLNPE